MKQLRFRKIWVILAIFLLVIPLTSNMERNVGAAAPPNSGEEEETTSLPPVGQQYTIGFSSELGEIDNSLDVARWDVELGDATGFASYNPGPMSAKITFTDGSDVDPAIFSELNWSYETKYVDPVNPAIVATGIEDPTDPLKMNFTTGVYYSGLILVEVSATFKLAGDPAGTVFPPIKRELIIAAPLQIKSDAELGKEYELMKTTTDQWHEDDRHNSLDSSVVLYANKAPNETIVWSYKDAVTGTTTLLENPLDEIKTSNVLGTVVSPDGIEGSGGDLLHKYKVSSRFGGMTTLVGRIYLNNDLTQPFIEQEFEMITVAGVTHAPNIDDNGDGSINNDDNYLINLEYGESALFKDLANDRGDSLSWSVNSVDLDKESVILNPTSGITGNFYGTSEIILSPIPSDYKDYGGMTFSAEVMDTMLVSTRATLLKGNTDNARVITEEIEVLNMNSTLMVSTNVRPTDDNLKYEWFYLDKSGNEQDLLSDSGDRFGDAAVKAVGEGTTSNGYSTHVQLTGVKTGTLKLICRVTDNGVPLEDLEVSVKIIDSLVLSESESRIPVGGSFVLRATSSSAGPMTITSADEESVSVGNVDGKTNEFLITGIQETAGWVDVIVNQQLNGQTLSATCRVQVITAVSEAMIEGESTILVNTTSDLTLVFAEGVPNYTKDEIKWVIKNKDGMTDVVSLIESTDPLQTSVKGLKVGEAYVAVVTNDSVQTEIAVITIRVVTSPTALDITEEQVLDYLPNGTHQLEYTIEPVGYIDSDQVVQWQSMNEAVATVDENGLVTYHSVGYVRIRAYINAEKTLEDYCEFDIQNPATGLTIEPTTANLRVGETISLVATITPVDTTDRTLTWTSSKEDVAEVSPAGLVTAKNAGTSIISVKTSNGLEATCMVVVQIPVKSIELNYTELSVRKGTVFYMAANVLPVEAYDRSVIWSVDDENILTIDESGVTTAESVGEATITATSNENNTITAPAIITVEEGVTGITLNIRDRIMEIGEQFQLIPTIRPSDAVNTAVTYTSSNAGAATVSADGLITAVKGGTTIITVKTVERGLIATCTITVQEDVTGITLDMDDIFLGKGETTQIHYTLTPATATMKTLEWTSSDESIVIVDNDGNIFGVNYGEATITARSKDDGEVEATCKVTVVEAIQDLQMSEELIRMMATTQHQLTVTTVPVGATIKKVEWASSDTTIATVDSFGLVKAVGEGECKITATATDGSNVSASCTVVVSPYIPITSVTVNSPTTTMLVGDRRTFTLRTYPNTTTETVNWSSSDTSIATVDNNGNVVAVGPGVVNVSVMGNTSGVTSAVAITVLGLNADNITIEQYASYDLYVDGVMPGNAAGNPVWFSRNKQIATVTAGGQVIGRRPGTTSIVARVNGKMVTCMVTVERLQRLTN